MASRVRYQEPSIWRRLWRRLLISIDRLPLLFIFIINPKLMFFFFLFFSWKSITQPFVWRCRGKLKKQQKNTFDIKGCAVVRQLSSPTIEITRPGYNVKVKSSRLLIKLWDKSLLLRAISTFKSPGGVQKMFKIFLPFYRNNIQLATICKYSYFYIYSINLLGK